MSTPDRTTIKAAVDALAAGLRSGLIADPPTAAKPFRRVEVGLSGVQEYPRPFLTLTLTRVRPIGSVDGDRLMRVSLSLRVVSDVNNGGVHDALLDRIAAVDDHLDGLVQAGLIEGADGLDDREWQLDYPKTTAAARVASATSTMSFVVRVERFFNRAGAS
ncbi:MAG: hypothetical protein J5J06_12240 [Phycisphaerae bacterium]|nr:hypothetical protein [Phycisphaerae bacterium]